MTASLNVQRTGLNNVRILFCGDVVGRAGRKAITQHVPMLREKLRLDFVIVNGENSAAGFGITQSICNQFVSAGVDVITAGDHAFDQNEVAQFIDGYPKLLRPGNFPDQLPGKGHNVYELADGRKVLVIHLMAQLFMKFQLNSPFEMVDAILKDYRMGANVDAVVVDFHGEATSEKMGMGHYVDGRASLVVGTHTHVPTADTQILPGGTGLQTDAGMCGDYNSVIGFEKKVPLEGFTRRVRTERLTPAGGEATLCGVFVETDNKTGLAKRVSPVRVGGRLSEALPESA
jgi:hypothetical protein